MLISTLLLTIGLLQAPMVDALDEATNQPQVDVNAPAFHVPGTPPPKPGRSKDTPPVIKDKPLPPV